MSIDNIAILQGVRALIVDVDGVLTDGKLYFSDSGDEIKAFHAHDGLGMKLLMQSGVIVCVITARNSPLLHRRMEGLGITHFYPGSEHKLSAYENFKKKTALNDAQIAYVGDDIIDLPVMLKVGVACSVLNACSEVRSRSDIVVPVRGGEGAVRWLCENIMQQQSTWEQIMKHFSSSAVDSDIVIQQ